MAVMTVAECAETADQERATYARYWQEMREESIRLISDAFDEVAERYALGETSAVVDVVMFCAEEYGSTMGIITALTRLLTASFTAHQVAAEYRDGISISELVKIVAPR
jgi:hypothetical protein